jgi:hypothetical protein
MSERLVVEAGDKTAEELLTALHDGRRIIVQTEFLDADHEVVLRYDGEIYYCDTPTRLHKHDSVGEMRTCLTNRGYGRPAEEHPAGDSPDAGNEPAPVDSDTNSAEE